MLRNQKGFSLIELMIVVAIIGILAAIAIPNFQKFQMKARQAEAKANLSGIFTAEKAFFAEYNTYGARFNSIGFAPEGISRYRVGFAADVAPPAGAPPGTATCFQNCAGAVVAVCSAGYALWTCNTGAATTTNSVPPSATVFTAFANGFINSNAGALEDQWSMNQLRNLNNVLSGL